MNELFKKIDNKVFNNLLDDLFFDVDEEITDLPLCLFIKS
jgi:hypothetical protein